MTVSYRGTRFARGKARNIAELERLAADEDPTVAEHARWALDRLLAQLLRVAMIGNLFSPWFESLLTN